MPRPKAATSRDEWGIHRREISRLFTVEEMPVAEIANHMRQKHGFDKKPKDYEYRFKKWRLRRNLHENELRYIHCLLLKRKEAGKVESEIVISGIRKPESLVLGRLGRHRSSRSLTDQLQIEVFPEFLARVQTPSPLLSDLPKWREELPWLQFNSFFRQAIASLRASSMTGPLWRSQEQGSLLIEMMSSYIVQSSMQTSKAQRDDRLHPPRIIRAELEVIAPQVHAGDHETTAEILHTGSQDSITLELVRVLIYLETNNMTHRFQEITGCNVDFSTSANLMGFLRHTGFLTKANINWLRRSADYTSQELLFRLLVHSIVDQASSDILGWLIPDHFNVNQRVRVSTFYWMRMTSEYKFMRPKLIDHYPKTLLQASSLAGNIEAVHLLLDLDADPFSKSGQLDYSPLECAASHDHDDRATIIADLLLSKQTNDASEYHMDALKGALQLAIAKSHTVLIMRLLSEMKRLGRGTIDPQYFSIAATHADCHTIRLLVENSRHYDDGSIILPKDILFSVFGQIGPHHDWDNLFDKLTFLMNLGADPAARGCECESECGQGSLLNVAIESILQDKNEEKCADSVLRLVETLRRHGCPPDRPKPTSGEDETTSPLQTAISLGHQLLVEYLLNWGANIDHYQGHGGVYYYCHSRRLWTFHKDQGRSPLLTALANGEIEIAKMLFRRNPNLKLRGGEQKLAMKAGDDTELVNMLLRGGSPDVDGLTEFLEQAILRDNPKSTSLLLSVNHSYHTSVDPVTNLQAGLRTGNQEMVYQQIPVCDYDARMLFEAVTHSHRYQGYHPIVECLLKTRPKTPNNSFEILAVASAASHRDMHLTQVLVRNFALGPWVTSFPSPGELKFNKEASLMGCVLGDLETSEMHILEYAVWLQKNREDAGAITTLLEFNLPAKGLRLRFATNLTPETWEQLIDAGAEANQDDLLWVIECGMDAHVEVLCKAQIPLNTMAINGFSRTPVQEAVECGRLNTLQMLLHYGADVKHPAGYFHGATCLQLTAGWGRIGLVRFLLGKGVKVNEKRSLLHGRTTIEIAAEHGRLDVLKLLLLQGEHLFHTVAERYQFIRAVRLAEKSSHQSIVKMLKQHISWDSNDQRLSDDCGQMVIRLDDMTQKLLDCELHEPKVFETMAQEAHDAGFEDVYDIEGIEHWIGERAEWSDGYSQGCSDCSSAAEGDIPAGSQLVTGQSRETSEIMGSAGELSTQSKHPSGQSLFTELAPPHTGIRDASANPVDLHVDQIKEQPPKQAHALSPSLRCLEGVQAVAPQAIHYQAWDPMWLDMQDGDMYDTMQDLSGGLATQSSTFGSLNHRPVSQSVSRESGVVLGEVLDEAPSVDGTGDDAADHNIVSPVGEGHSSAQNFWGFWDDETFTLLFGQSGY